MFILHTIIILFWNSIFFKAVFIFLFIEILFLTADNNYVVMDSLYSGILYLAINHGIKILRCIFLREVSGMHDWLSMHW